MRQRKVISLPTNQSKIYRQILAFMNFMFKCLRWLDTLFLNTYEFIDSILDSDRSEWAIQHVVIAKG